VIHIGRCIETRASSPGTHRLDAPRDGSARCRTDLGEPPARRCRMCNSNDEGTGQRRGRGGFRPHHGESLPPKPAVPTLPVVRVPARSAGPRRVAGGVPAQDVTTLTTAPDDTVQLGRWRALAVTQIAAFMALLDVSIVNVALPFIERGQGASPTAVQWVVSGYGLAFGLALVPAGRLGDSLGRRRRFLIGLSAFVVTSALSGGGADHGPADGGSAPAGRRRRNPDPTELRPDPGVVRGRRAGPGVRDSRRHRRGWPPRPGR
jgi:hypothetical protein